MYQTALEKRMMRGWASNWFGLFTLRRYLAILNKKYREKWNERLERISRSICARRIERYYIHYLERKNRDQLERNKN